MATGLRLKSPLLLNLPMPFDTPCQDCGQLCWGERGVERHRRRKHRGTTEGHINDPSPVDDVEEELTPEEEARDRWLRYIARQGGWG